jgi:hypothetical protein
MKQTKMSLTLLLKNFNRLEKRKEEDVDNE